MNLDIITKLINQNHNQNNLMNLKKNPSSKIYSYQTSYVNDNGIKKFMKKKIISNGNKTKIYKNINGKEIIYNIDSKDITNKLLSKINIPFVNNNYKKYNDNYKINNFLLIFILTLLIYIAIKLTIKK